MNFPFHLFSVGFALIGLAIPVPSKAFPEMIRHHYVQCAACHVAASGGGLLTAYGRSISSELLSTWGSETESRAFYSIAHEKIDEWLNVGGDIRSVQIHKENENSVSGRPIWMEANIKAALKISTMTLVTSLGQVEQSNQSWKSEINSFYIQLQLTDELSFRIGQFAPVYGLQIPQHNFLIKQNIGLSPSQMRDTVDVQWHDENYDVVLSFSKSHTSSRSPHVETAQSGQVQKTFFDSHKLGLNFWSGDSAQNRKLLLGFHGILGWAESFYTILEYDHLWTKDNNDIESKSQFQLLKNAYEFFKGMHIQIVQEWGTSLTSDQFNLGFGFIWYPRPHFEIETLISRKESYTQTNSSEIYGYLMTHFYF